jgi:hypothetical protein
LFTRYISPLAPPRWAGLARLVFTLFLHLHCAVKMPHQYSELPLDDKLEAEHVAPAPKRSRWGRLSLLLVAPLLLLASALAAVGVADLLSGPNAQSPLGSFSWLSHVARAPDGQFLLGVGKADITGYVKRRFPSSRSPVADSHLADPLSRSSLW